MQQQKLWKNVCYYTHQALHLQFQVAMGIWGSGDPLRPNLKLGTPDRDGFPNMIIKLTCSPHAAQPKVRVQVVPLHATKKSRTRYRAQLIRGKESRTVRAAWGDAGRLLTPPRMIA